MKRIKHRILIILFSFCLIVVASQLSFGQCAMCKQNAENAAGTEAKGLNLGIMYLLIVPYALVGGIGYWWYIQKKKEKGAEVSDT